MKISYNWLKEFLPDLDRSPDEVAELLTLHAFETVVERTIKIDPHVTIAKITKLEPHPNADRLQLATVTTGDDEVRVVCGAPNIQEGDIVPYSPPGTQLHDEKGESFTLQEATIRGEKSPGMLNSPRELGLGEAHAEIYILPPDTPVGSKLADHLPNDVVFEADITPNRAHDALSHRGVAREVAAVLNLKIIEPTLPPLPDRELSDWQLTIENDQDTPRYLGILIQNVRVQPSPLWMQVRLWAVGTRPISNLVDITNYVMFEIGNPTHLFDAKKLPGKNIGVRSARAGETLTTLDGKQRTLSPTHNNLVITSDDTPVALAGVMGGADTEVGKNTSTVFLEAANFRAYLIQESAAASKLRSESAARFSKSITPALVEPAAARALELLEQLASGEGIGKIEHYPRPATAVSISFNPQRISDVAGVAIKPDVARDALERLSCTITETDLKAWQVTPPIERLDLTAEHDLIEEVIRLVGLERIPAVAPTAGKSQSLPAHAQWREQVRDTLVALGFTETYNYSFDDEAIRRLLELPEGERLSLRNPPSPEEQYLKNSLLPRLLSHVLANKGELSKKFTDVEQALFEIGVAFYPGNGGAVEGVREEEHIAGVLVGKRATKDEAKGAIEAILEQFGITEPYTNFGYIEELPATSPIVKKIKLPIVTFELDLAALIKAAQHEPTYAPGEYEAVQYQAPSKFPPTYRDLSILVDPSTSVEQVQNIIERVGGPLVADVDLFDEYEPAVADTKGLAFHIAYQSREKTLSSDEVNELHNRVVVTLKEELGATLRE